MKFLRRFIGGNEGVAAVEFAMVAPVLFLLIFGITEFSLIMYATSIIEGATTNSSRMGKTGYTEAGMTREEMIYDIIKDEAGSLFNPDHLVITAKAYNDYDDIGVAEDYDDNNGNGTYDVGDTLYDTNGNGVWDSDIGAAGLGGAGDVVVYTVSYPWELFTPLIGSMFENSTYTITTSIVVKNEPYDLEAI